MCLLANKNSYFYRTRLLAASVLRNNTVDIKKKSCSNFSSDFEPGVSLPNRVRTKLRKIKGQLD